MEASKVTLEQLKDLKRELEERDLDTGGSKSELQNHLRKALRENDEDPDTSLFELEESISSGMKKLSVMDENATNLEAKIFEKELLGNSRSLREELRKNSRSLEEKFSRNLKEVLFENSWKLKEEFLENSRNLEVKINDNTRSLEKKLKEDSRNLAEKFRDEISKETQKLRQEVDSLYALIEECAVKPLALAYAACATTTPQTPFARYLSAFENVAEAYSWTKEEKVSALKGSLRDDAIDLIQNLNANERKDYDLLVQCLEERYGNRHLEQVYRIELKHRTQRSNESLQDFECAIVRLIGLSYPTRLAEYLENMAKDVFIDGLKDTETATTVRMARPKTLSDVLALALEFEIAKQASRGPSEV
ncbi:hypothetical protein J437_LFUL007391 [Ladona fulva]|uniref:SAP domain-containing protein n=1 Tax=Ladona fulva TaxID=123851 RepID=A0A8K0K1Z1_LADFU|nr:hypothetical protein J437_LFUL007391 [Ladona fulva]